MRYARTDDLQKLALKMQASAEGLCLADIEQEFKVSRRTAERMRDSLLRNYPQLEEVVADGGRKYWRFPSGSLRRMVEPTLDELAAGHRAAAIARREGDSLTAERLELLLTKVQAMFKPELRRQMAPDLEAQLLADGVAFRPGPREQLDPDILSQLRHAILAGVMISADHRARASGKLSQDTRLGPIAMLLGEGRQYLLAWIEYKDDQRLFALAGFESVTLEDEIYTRPPDFDLQEWLSESFGIWREAPRDVEWRFLPKVAEDAATYVFHPKQTSERLPDGSLIVRFRAGGHKEMNWYLARWGDQVEVLK